MRHLKLSIIVFITFSSSVFAQPIDMDLFHGMQPRNIGPAGMSGRVTAIDVVLNDLDVIYIGAAAGGIWKSENSGHTWLPIFENEGAASIGAISIYQKNPSIIYVGTGEGNPRNSQNSGRGMYKTVDGGSTWEFLGLKNTRQIHRVIVHPSDPDIVWAGVSGASWGESEDRGVYKTVNGGQTWNKILYVNESTGVSDMVADPNNPNKIIVGMWEHTRKPWTFKSGGPNSGIYITHDGGTNWSQLDAEAGLPKGELGRTGFSFAPSNSNIVYAYIESKSNAIYKSQDGGKSWKQVSQKGDRNIGGRPFYYADIYVDTKNENRIYSIASEVTMSEDGGKTWSVFAPGNKIHTDHHAWWSHPDDPEYIMIGHDGGLNTSHDRGKNWTFADNLPLAQFYHIRVDNEFPYNVMGGLQDNGSWRGPNRTWFKGGIRNMYWQRLSVGDGFDVVPDPLDPSYGYAMGQAGNLVRWHTTSGQLKKIKPSHPTAKHLRFNWNSGIGIDPTDQKTIYYGSQFVHKSNDHGQSWEIISPDLTTDDPEKTKFLETGGLSYDVTGAENHCTIISIDPSSLDPKVIWVGTDDGNLQVTSDGGTTWNNRIKNIKGVPSNTWVTQVTASAYDPAAAVVVFDDHRRNNWEPYVFMTKDYGLTWKRLADTSDVDGYVYCFVQDPVEQDLMFIGSEFGLYVSFDGGSQWQKWTQGLPTMPVSDLVIHPREHDLVIGTFGRAIWILDDVRPLREMTKKKITDKQLHLFTPPDEHIMVVGESIGYRQGKIGDALYNGENRAYGAMLTYWYSSDQSGEEEDENENDTSEAKIEIRNSEKEVVRTIYHKAKHGINRTNWRTNIDAVRPPQTAKPKKEDKPKGGFYAPSGDYYISVIIGQDTSSNWLKIAPDPRLTISADEISEKQKQIKAYNIKLTKATALADEVRAEQEKIQLQKNVLLLNMDESDTIFTQLDSISKEINVYKESILGKKVQGIYRDPSVLSSLTRSIGYAIDHPLSPVTANQEIQLLQLEKAIVAKSDEWQQLKSKCRDAIALLLKDVKTNLWKE